MEDAEHGAMDVQTELLTSGPQAENGAEQLPVDFVAMTKIVSPKTIALLTATATPTADSFIPLYVFYSNLFYEFIFCNVKDSSAIFFGFIINF